MSIDKEVSKAKQEIVKDGLDMSLGEIMRIYERGELIIQPEYQRLYRWDDSRRTRFIESLILGIPIPPIFVFTDEKGRWELIDGLQRLSTIFHYAGILKNADGEKILPFSPSGTKLLPSLDGLSWLALDEDEDKALPMSIRLDVERARIRVEILKRESDQRAKYELFQRLNTGGAKLSEQEVRNCVIVMLNKELYRKLELASQNLNFIKCTAQTEKSISEQKPIELLLRFLAYRYKDYDQKIDVHVWLDDVAIDMATDVEYDIDSEILLFNRIFVLLEKSLSAESFKKYDNGNFIRGFLISAYEAITHGMSKNIDNLEVGGEAKVIDSIKNMWADARFTDNAKAGVRGTTRLANILPIAVEWF
ncbi:DUF262 domain-containing protein [Shewanella sp. SM55]|uniref:DUF262 domain-containing protein n=1 Tax=Shewanella sp. SM55 TaxID=2912800 RepID=UPI0021D85693|nr:DUF262 domain-containing protein [Shewanella sp. SM55]MCU8061706.1 DUF262 domain-containing protein [Shewanella sp. SM55]